MGTAGGKHVLPCNLKRWGAVAELARTTLGATNDLGDLIEDGLAFHHAGVPSHLLREIENLTRLGALRMVGATTTVAEGAHLPFQVVIIPHLNFAGPTGKLEKDLYQNIVGRAGRATVAIEGLVFVIGSDSITLRNHVQDVLWDTRRPVAVQGQLLPTALQSSNSEDDHRTNREIQSQILAWLGDSNSYVEAQAAHFARQTFSWWVSPSRTRDQIENMFDTVIQDLEEDGLAEAASPYVLTPLGRRSRLAGLGKASCLRLAQLIDSVPEETLTTSLVDRCVLDADSADLVTRVVFEAEEVLERSFWFRRYTSRLKRGREKVVALQEIMNGTRPWPYDEEMFQIDLALLSGWIQGMDFVELGEIPPIMPGRGIFSSEIPGERASDVAEQLGRVAYPAAWAWSAFAAMLGSHGDLVAPWIRSAIELGVPSETAVEIIRHYSISRSSAVTLARALVPVWEVAQDSLVELSDLDFRDMKIPASDRTLIRSRLDN